MRVSDAGGRNAYPLRRFARSALSERAVTAGNLRSTAAGLNFSACGASAG